MMYLLILAVLLSAVPVQATSLVCVEGSEIMSWARYAPLTCPDRQGLHDLGREQVVDRRTQKWNGARVVSKTAAEIAAYDAAQPEAQAKANLQAFKDQCAAIQADPVAPTSSKDLCAALLKVVK